MAENTVYGLYVGAVVMSARYVVYIQTDFLRTVTTKPV